MLRLVRATGWLLHATLPISTAVGVCAVCCQPTERLGSSHAPKASSVLNASSSDAGTTGATFSAMPPASLPASSHVPAGEFSTTYPWLSDDAPDAPVGRLQERFAPPQGYSRVAVPWGGFGAWLRDLPLASQDTPVRSYSGAVIHPAGHANIAAVVAIDVGKADLQQCADSIIRLHAEWQWSRGIRDITYRSAAGIPMSYQRWVAGDRPMQKGASLTWQAGAAPVRDDHANFRKYLDAVFMFANTGALAAQARPIDPSELAPGDFVVEAGAPGHAVLVLDVAESSGGRKVALLGQGYMPAQSFQVLRVSTSQTWFEMNPQSKGVTTPFWRPFGWSLLRRLVAAP